MISLNDVKRKKKAETDRGYYGELYRKYGNAHTLSLISHIKILFVSDTNDELRKKTQFTRDVIWNIQEPADIIFLLGGISHNDMQILLPYFGARPIYGIKGDTDTEDIYSAYYIPELNENTVSVQDITFAGIAGALSYKTDIRGYTQEESIKRSKEIPQADILLSHAPAWDEQNNNAAKAGLKGISEYLYRCHISYHFYGHIMEDTEKTLSNGCLSRSIYGCRMVSV